MPDVPTIAVLSSNEPFAGILAATLRSGRRGWRVREFHDPAAVMSYMRLAPVMLLVGDYQLGANTLADVASGIRCYSRLVSQDTQIVALASTVDETTRLRCVQAGIDEVIAKPMSPAYLEERILARLARGVSDYVEALPHYVGPERRGRFAFSDARIVPSERRIDNVISFVAHRAARETSNLRPDA